jgi:hypothetical protein
MRLPSEFPWAILSAEHAQIQIEDEYENHWRATLQTPRYTEALLDTQNEVANNRSRPCL